MTDKNPRVFCITSNNYLWALRPFSYLFNQYWGNEQQVVVAGCKPPDFELPSNIRFHSLRRTDYPVNKWSDMLVKLLIEMPDEYFVLMLEDYWLTRNVDLRFIQVAYAYMSQNPSDILKIDLTVDRMHARGDARDAIDYCNIGPYDIIITPYDTPYRMSLQAAMWNKSLMLKLLKLGKSPWEVEIHTNPPPEMYVFGTRQWPVRYANAVYKGELDEEEVLKVKDEHRKEIVKWIPPNIPKRNK
jgi:hypothetical protein